MSRVGLWARKMAVMMEMVVEMGTGPVSTSHVKRNHR